MIYSNSIDLLHNEGKSFVFFVFETLLLALFFSAFFTKAPEVGWMYLYDEETTSLSGKV